MDRDDPVPNAIRDHADQLGGNLVLLKTFLEAKQNEQHAFLREQREASDLAQGKSRSAARWSAVAAVFAALAAAVQAYDAVMTP